MLNLGLGAVIAVALAAALWRLLPHGWFLQQLAVAMPVEGSAQRAGGDPIAWQPETLVGQQGVAVTALFPSGQIEVDGRRFEARLEVGFAPPGTKVMVKSVSDFGVVVEELA